jgi:hypothetical protein
MPLSYFRLPKLQFTVVVLILDIHGVPGLLHRVIATADLIGYFAIVQLPHFHDFWFMAQQLITLALWATRPLPST